MCQRNDKIIAAFSAAVGEEEEDLQLGDFYDPIDEWLQSVPIDDVVNFFEDSDNETNRSGPSNDIVNNSEYQRIFEDLCALPDYPETNESYNEEIAGASGAIVNLYDDNLGADINMEGAAEDQQLIQDEPSINIAPEQNEFMLVPTEDQGVFMVIQTVRFETVDYQVPTEASPEADASMEASEALQYDAGDQQLVDGISHYAIPIVLETVDMPLETLTFVDLLEQIDTTNIGHQHVEKQYNSSPEPSTSSGVVASTLPIDLSIFYSNESSSDESLDDTSAAVAKSSNRGRKPIPKKEREAKLAKTVDPKALQLVKGANSSNKYRNNLKAEREKMAEDKNKLKTQLKKQKEKYQRNKKLIRMMKLYFKSLGVTKHDQQ